MPPTLIAPLGAHIVRVALASSTLLAFAAAAEPPAPAHPPAKPMQQTRPVGPGIQALAAASTDVVVVEVLKTSPQRAMEGARDTVRLKVVRTLLGSTAADDTLDVYYHLLWADPQAHILEPKRFEKGRRYLVFLKSYVDDRGKDGKRVAYKPVDQWLWVQPAHPPLIREAAAAVRVPHGDARGEWSRTEGSIAGLQGRLVLYLGEPSNGTPISKAFLDLRNTSGGGNTVEFVLDGSKTVWKIVNADGKPSVNSSLPGNWISTSARKITLASGKSGRLPLTVSGAGVMKDSGGHLELGPKYVWVFKRGDVGPYLLSGTVTIAPTGGRGQWSGTLDLPRVKIPSAPD
jgi:hypothetical protein